MPPAPIPPDQLRERANILRRVAHRLDQVLALDLHRRADDSAWLGPTPSRCHDELVAMRITLLGAGRQLRDKAATLDRRADQLRQP